jgi:hypothetical protein
MASFCAMSLGSSLGVKQSAGLQMDLSHSAHVPHCLILQLTSCTAWPLGSVGIAASCFPKSQFSSSERERSEFLATDPEVSGSILGATRFSEK